MGVKNLRIAVCDDDPLELQKIKGYVDAYPPIKKEDGGIVVGTFCSGSELLADIRAGGGYDLLILDIVMPGLSGIDLAARIREQDNACRIVFLTSSADFALDSYKVKAYYYLLKNEMKSELPVLLRRIAGEMAEETASASNKGKTPMDARAPRQDRICREQQPYGVFPSDSQ
jgi:DNA-binding LytR/AlgR family response regulator